MIRSLPLAKLVPSPRNVRRSSEPHADTQLKADIAARGLLQNLIVSPVGKPRGTFAVEAGNRRLVALRALQDEGALPDDHEVPCLVLERGTSPGEASLAENFQRLAMNPADECLAFQQLLADGSDVEGVARRFGVTVRFVEGRLRLANLAPCVFDALAAGEISLDIAKAYASTADQDRQAQVFEQMSRGYGYTHPDSIRRMMTCETVSGRDRRALFVGETAYIEAGGRVEHDLFADEDEARWLDIALLERLAGEKLQDEADRLAAELGYGFVRPTLERWVGHDLVRDLQRLAIEPVPLTADEARIVEDLEAEIEAQVELLDDEEVDASAREAAETAIGDISERIDALTDRQPDLDPETKGRAGVIVMLDEQGRVRIDPTIYVRPDDGTGLREPELDDEIDDGEGPQDGPSSAGGPGRLSQRLVDELAIQRRDILAIHVAANPALALDLAIFLMVDRDMRHSFENRGSSLSANRPSDPVFGFETPGAPATAAAREADAMLDRKWADGETLAARFDAFRALGEDARAAWLGHAVARTLEASGFGTARACRFHDHLGELLEIDVAAWWRPTGANYFDRIPKGVAAAALKEVGGDALANRYAKAKKAELAQACERIFAGDFIGDADTKQAALAWVPAAMRFAGQALADGDESMHGAGDLQADDAAGSDHAVSSGPGDEEGQPQSVVQAA